MIESKKFRNLFNGHRSMGILRYVIVFLGVFVLQLACGVKGDPLPPESPVEIGRGRPTYKKASEEVSLPELPVTEDDDEEEEGEDELDESL